MKSGDTSKEICIDSVLYENKRNENEKKDDKRTPRTLK